MEPTLTQLALAAAALIPTQPHIEVNLRNWENKTSGPINFFHCQNDSRKLIAQLAPGITDMNMIFALESDGQNGSVMRCHLASSCHGDLHGYLDFTLLSKELYFKLDPYCKAVDDTEILLPALKYDWDAQSWPKYILFNIDATIESGWGNSSFKMSEEKIAHEKLG